MAVAFWLDLGVVMMVLSRTPYRWPRGGYTSAWFGDVGGDLVATGWVRGNPLGGSRTAVVVCPH